jgi:hypothetical protein
MPRNTGTGDGSVLNVLKTIFEQGVKNDINSRVPGWAALSREGTKMPTRAKTHKFAIKGNIGQTARVYGANDPCGGFAQCDVPPEYCDVELLYKKLFASYRVCHETIREAGTEGAMFDVLENDLIDLVEQMVNIYERSIFTGDGRNVLFTLADTGTDNGDGTFTYEVQWYGGFENEQLGDTLEQLLLVNLHVQAAADCGEAPRDVEGKQIQSVDGTPGAETITTVGSLGAVSIGDIVYPSREDADGVQGCTDGLTGFPLLCDDFSLSDPFQGVTAESCPSFAGRICDNGGETRPLTEELMEQAVGKSFVRQGGSRKESVSFKRFAFFTHEYTARKFGLQLTADRRWAAPAFFTPKGLKPNAGFDMDYLTYDGIPFITSQKGLRNSLFLMDLANTVIVHNGAPEGQFLAAPNGPTVERVPCTPTFEWIWWAYLDFATRRRNGNVWLKDVEFLDECAKVE